MLRYGLPRPAPLMFLSFLYGVLFALFCWWIFLLNHHHAGSQATSCSAQRWSSVSSISGLLLFAIITLHIIIQLAPVSAALNPGKLPSGPRNFWEAELSDGAEMAFTVLVTFIGDSLMVYRLWVIRKSRRIIVLPLMALTAGLACGISATYYWARLDCSIGPEGASCDMTNMGPSSLPTGFTFASLTVLINTYCSGIIAWTLYQNLHTAQARHGGPTIVDVIQILVESAALYVVFALVYATIYAIYFYEDTERYSRDSVSQSFISTVSISFAPMVGITFMLINVRVALGYAITSQSSSLGQFNTAWIAGRMATSRFAESTRRNSVASADQAGAGGTVIDIVRDRDI